MAVTPGVQVSIAAFHGGRGVVLDVANFADRYDIVPGAIRKPRHRLLEAAVDELPPPDGIGAEINIRSAMPPGAGTGTSAAVAVAMVGALAALRGERLSHRDAAYAAYRLETDRLGGESGIQDQLSAAHGGINYVEIDAFPGATVTPLPAWPELDRLLTLVYLGRAHDSTTVHRQVIATAADGRTSAFTRLRGAAGVARDAVASRDLFGLGRAMIANTEAQESLHPALIGTDARRVIELASCRGAIGWKVNGAGGEGGTVTLLSATEADRKLVESSVTALDPAFRLIRVRISTPGLEVVRDDPSG